MFREVKGSGEGKERENKKGEVGGKGSSSLIINSDTLSV